ncbi:MAG: 50S ribosomal protein L25 [Aureliella sp.]
MSTESITVEKREALGSAACRRLRGAGKTPANLYGHGEDNLNLSLDSKIIENYIHSGVKVLALQGAVNDTALISEVQWDAFGSDVVHVDLTRVSKSEKVDVTLPLEVHGEAPGVKAGGILTIAVHEVVIQCSAAAIPESIHCNVSSLELDQSLHGSDLELPEGAVLVTPAEEDLVVQVASPSGTETEATDEDGSEPEVISKGKEEEEGSE